MASLALGGLMLGPALGPRFGVGVDLNRMARLRSGGQEEEGKERLGPRGCPGASDLGWG